MLRTELRNVPEVLVGLPEGMGSHEGADMGRDGVRGRAWGVLRTSLCFHILNEKVYGPLLRRLLPGCREASFQSHTGRYT